MTGAADDDDGGVSVDCTAPNDVSAAGVVVVVVVVVTADGTVAALFVSPFLPSFPSLLLLLLLLLSLVAPVPSTLVNNDGNNSDPSGNGTNRCGSISRTVPYGNPIKTPVSYGRLFNLAGAVLPLHFRKHCAKL